MNCSESGCNASEEPAPDPRRLRDHQGDRPRRLRRGVRRQAAPHGARLRHEDPQQVGHAQTRRGRLFPRREGRPRQGRSTLDHRSSLRLPGRQQSRNFSSILFFFTSFSSSFLIFFLTQLLHVGSRLLFQLFWMENVISHGKLERRP